MGSKQVEKFQEAASEIASSLKPLLNKKNQVKINTHTDPDGITSGNIFARCLNYYDIPFHISFESPPEEKDVEELKKQEYDLFVFLDQGTGQFEFIDKHLLENNRSVIILDHHPGDVEERPKLDYLNPHEFGLSGAEDVSSSGVTYSIIEKIDEKFETLSELAIIGALGDRQETPEGLTGVNEKILEKSVQNGFLKTKEGLKIGFRNLPIIDCLTRSIRPFLPGLSGKKEEAEKLVDSLNMEPEKSVEDLSTEEEEKLRDGILERIETDTSENLKTSIWGTIYQSELDQTVGPKNAHEYVTMIDACEKLGNIGIGFSAMLGDKDSGEKALEKLEEYQKEMTNTVNWLTENKEKIKTTNNIRYLDLEDELESKKIGELLSITLEAGIVKKDKPFLGLTKTKEDKLKISARASSEYAKKGIDLGEVMKKVSTELEGSGGGHNVAAAARLPLERKDEFLKKADKFVEEFI